MSLTLCKYCRKVIIQGRFCNDECEALFDKEEAETYCASCHRGLKNEDELCDNCRFKR